MIRIKYSSGRGNYVSAIQPINDNELITTFTGLAISFSDTLKLKEDESFALQTDLNQYIYLDAPYRFFNHSCEPNCGLTPELELIAIRNIREDEELTYDYSTTMLEHHWQMRCTCMAARCRQLITDFSLLPADTKRSYIEKNIVQSFIRRVLHLDIS